MPQRGLVVSPPIKIDGDALFLGSPALDAQELRSWLLFWDKLDWPSNNMIRIASGPDEQFLESAGILTRTSVAVRASGDVTQFYRLAHLAGYYALDAKEPGCWSLARGEKSISFPGDDLEAGRGILVSLCDAIPVPDKEVPLNEILNFKAKRSDELRSFRLHIERLYQKIAAQPDLQLAILAEKADFEKSLTDYIRVAKETKWPFRLTKEFSAKITISGSDLAIAAALGYALPQPLGYIMGAASLIKVTAGVGLKGKESTGSPAATTSPFEYVWSYHRDLFV